MSNPADSRVRYARIFGVASLILGVMAVGGWLAFVVGIVEYYVAAGLYAIDVREALASRGMLEE